MISFGSMFKEKDCTIHLNKYILRHIEKIISTTTTGMTHIKNIRKIDPFWPILFCIFVIGLGFVNYYSVFGWWISTWNEEIWLGFNVYDPATAYFMSGIEFFQERYPHFRGHPGLPLMLEIQIIAKIPYFLNTCFNSSGIDYYAFLAKNFYDIIFFCKLFTLFTHFITFIVLYRIARRFLNHQMAKIVVVAYATNFSLLYMSSKIMPDTLMILFMFLALDFMWQFYEQIELNKIKKGYLFIVCASFFIVAALFTKMMIVAPLIFLFPLGLIFQRKTFGNKIPIALPVRLKGFLIFVFCTTIFSIMWSYKLNWEYFFKMWFKALPGGVFSPSPGSLEYVSELSILGNYISVLGKVINSFFGLLWERVVTLFTKPFDQYPHHQLWFFGFEGMFFITSFYGVIRFLKEKHNTKLAYSYWIFGMNIFLLPILFYRWEFHYFLFILGSLSIFFSYLLNQFLSRYKLGNTMLFTISLCLTLIIHAPPLTVSFLIKKRDVIIYRTHFKKYRDALNAIDYHEKIGHFGGKTLENQTGRIVGYPHHDKDKNRLSEEIKKHFIYLEKLPSNDELKKNSIRIIIPYHKKSIIRSMY